MGPCLIDRIEVQGLWGWRELELDFCEDVNILIGPNGSGKTTVLDLMRFALTADVERLMQMRFKVLTLRLRGFDDDGVRTLRIEPKDRIVDVRVSRKVYRVDVDSLERQTLYSSSYRRRRFVPQLAELQELLRTMVPAAWLPVSRRIPGLELGHDERPCRRRRTESVDECLGELLEQLSRYRLRLSTELSKLHQAFQREVLSVTLYSKEHDKFEPETSKPPTTKDQDQLVRAFDRAGLLDTEMKTRIKRHFDLAVKAIDRMRASQKKQSGYNIEDVFFLPLVGRTKTMVQAARKLEIEIERLFQPLRRYERTLESFLIGKNVSVEDTGDLVVTSESPPMQSIGPRMLASGEKQLLILLTQALLYESRPLVYVADEPELSLHVTWQEKLLETLRTLGGQTQIIVATHSPDIVGPFSDRVIDLGKI